MNGNLEITKYYKKVNTKSSKTYTDDIEHVDDNRLKDDPLVLHVKVVVDGVATDDHANLIKLFKVDGIVLEDDNVFKSFPCGLTIFGLNVECISAALVDGYAEFETVGAGIRGYVARKVGRRRSVKERLYALHNNTQRKTTSRDIENANSFTDHFINSDGKYFNFRSRD